jgi:hypothetical protein
MCVLPQAMWQIKELSAPLHWLWPRWASGSTHRLQQALSQLRSLSIKRDGNPRCPCLAGSTGHLLHTADPPGAADQWTTWAGWSTRHTAGLRPALLRSRIPSSPEPVCWPLGTSPPTCCRETWRTDHTWCLVSCVANALHVRHCYLMPLTVQALELFVSHPVAQTRTTRLTLGSFPRPLLPLGGAASRLRNLRELQVDKCVSVSQVKALQRLSCLTSLTVLGHDQAGEPSGDVLQPADLPPRLQVLSMVGLSLYALEGWLPALIAVSLRRYLLVGISHLWHP